MNETMNAIQAFILGLVQGLGEFLPISSSGHLMLAQKIMGFDTSNMLTLNVLLHLATLVAVFAVYWKRFWNMLCHPIKSDLWLLVVATIPAVIAALTINFDAAFEGAFLAWSFLLTSVVLVAAEWLAGHWHRPAKHVTFKHAIIMGVMQAIAILPGLSRSGSTIAGGVGSGLSRKRAADFSFMMSAPAILGSAVLEGKKLLEGTASIGVDALPLVIAVITAGVSGYLAIRFMLRIIRKISLNWFALYTAILGVVLLANNYIFHWISFA